jgi:hypothetical protein
LPGFEIFYFALLKLHFIQLPVDGPFYSTYLYELILEAQSSKLKAQSSKLKAQSSKLKAQSSKLKAQSSKLKAQSSKLKAQSSKLKAQSSKPLNHVTINYGSSKY